LIVSAMATTTVSVAVTRACQSDFFTVETLKGGL
jgi:hypothetical protein